MVTRIFPDHFPGKIDYPVNFVQETISVTIGHQMALNSVAISVINDQVPSARGNFL